MAIGCQKCGYVMTFSEALGYFFVEVYNLLTKVILPFLLDMHAKRGLKDWFIDTRDGIIVACLNANSIKCHVCFCYNGWSIKEIVEIKKGVEEELR